LHHTAQAKDAKDINVVKYLCNNKNQVSCHFIVSKTGEIYQIATVDTITHHAGISERDGKKNLNPYSIGIEICSDGYEYTDAQRDAVSTLVKYLLELLKLDHTRVVRHKDISP
jgi:N-acetylmuramoyl-L-alanine amidase